MKKILMSLIILNCLLVGIFIPIQQASSIASSNEIVISSEYTYLYKNKNKSDRYDFKISHGEILTYTSETDDFYEVYYTYNEISYTGFIWAEHATLNLENQDVVITYNATISADTKAHSLEDNSELDMLVEKGTRIFLFEGYSSKEKFLPARFLYEGKLVTASFDVKVIRPDGINKALIIGVTAIVAVVRAVLILLGLRKNKWHKRLKLKKS